MKYIKVTNEINGSDFTFLDNGDDTIIEKLEGFEYPSVKSVVEDIPSTFGAVYVTSSFGRRRFSWAGDFVGNNPHSVRRNFGRVARQDGNLKLIEFETYDGLKLRCYADIVSILNPYTNALHRYLIEVVAPDCRFYSQEEIEVDIPYEDIYGGFDVVTNLGNELTHPVFTIHGPGNYFTIENTITGESFVIDFNLEGNGEIIIDTLNRTVTKDGVSIFAYFTGSFFGLEPDVNTISFDVGSGADVTTSLKVTYRYAYSSL